MKSCNLCKSSFLCNYKVSWFTWSATFTSFTRFVWFTWSTRFHDLHNLHHLLFSWFYNISWFT